MDSKQINQDQKDSLTDHCLDSVFLMEKSSGLLEIFV